MKEKIYEKRMKINSVLKDREVAVVLTQSPSQQSANPRSYLHITVDQAYTCSHTEAISDSTLQLYLKVQSFI